MKEGIVESEGERKKGGEREREAPFFVFLRPVFFWG